VFFSFWGGESNDEKKYKIKYDEGLRWLNGGHNNQPKVGVNGGGGTFERRRDRGGMCGGGCLFVPAGKLNNKKALGGRQSIKKCHNQPSDSVGGGGLFEVRRYCGGTYGGDDITSFGHRIN
jgi:hypothetical protein